MKIRAGGALCHRNPAQAAVTAARTIATSSASPDDRNGYAAGLRNIQNAMSV